MSDPVTPYLAARTRGMLAVLVLVVGGLFGYTVHERKVVNHLSAENTQMVSALKDTQAQMAALTVKLDSMTAPQPSAEAKPSPAPAIQEQRKPAARKTAARRSGGTDRRFKKFQTQLDAQGREIESTKQYLASTRTELQGSIARTHDELVVLQKKGERAYYEFDVDKSKQFKKTGPVGLSLRKASTKDMYADLKLIVDDVQLSKKHVNLYEPVMFYPAEAGQPVEVVINSIRKNHIHGYISMSKYTAAELAALSAGNSGGSAAGQDGSSQPVAPNAASSERRKLPVPR